MPSHQPTDPVVPQKRALILMVKTGIIPDSETQPGSRMQTYAMVVYLVQRPNIFVQTSQDIYIPFSPDPAGKRNQTEKCKKIRVFLLFLKSKEISS